MVPVNLVSQNQTALTVLDVTSCSLVEVDHILSSSYLFLSSVIGTLLFLAFVIGTAGPFHVGVIVFQFVRELVHQQSD